MSERGVATEADVVHVHDLLRSRPSLTRAHFRMFGLTDRRGRAAIAELRRRGVPVISESAAGSAYRLARSLGELDAFLREHEARAMDQLAQIRSIRAHAAEHLAPHQARLIS